jgi:hypothetical protein
LTYLKLGKANDAVKNYHSTYTLIEQNEIFDINTHSVFAYLGTAYQRCPSRLKSCRDGFRKIFSNFTAATVLDQKYWY